ncbi:MAG TPA: sugar transferase [Chitinophagaceae bacterium]|nr:sugar transferase [Chitinophagaceae bacterium]
MQFNAYRSIKRFMDILLAIAGTIILLPLLIFTAVLVKLSSKGPIFFLQERVGLNRTPFLIWKFRSMYITAEVTGPQLSSDEDKRVTGWGKIMRKWRLDELPQLWNVVKSDMSIVGPRPERKYYIEQIVRTHPEYLNLLKVKPGLTSLGMVKFGYAENVDEMIKRMKYDLSYVEKSSILLDIKIMLQSIKVVFAGKGK